MNKQKQLMKVVIKQAVICVVIIAVFAGVYFFTDGLVTSSAEKKTGSEASLSKDQGEITTLTTQLDKAGAAEKNFIAIQESRDNTDFSVDNDKLKEWLRQAKSQFRFSNSFKLSITTPKTSTSPEFTGMNYDVIEHPAMKLEFSAMSDTHVFSFLNALRRNAPGFIRIDSLTMKRTADIDPTTVNSARTGGSPFAVDAKIEFNWIGLKEKPPKDAPAAAPAAGGAAPAAGAPAAAAAPAPTPTPAKAP